LKTHKTRKRARVIVAASEPLLLVGLRSVLVGLPEFDLPAACGTLDETLDAVKRHRPRVLVFDSGMCPDSDIDTCARLHRTSPTTTVVWLTRLGSVPTPEILLGSRNIVLPSFISADELVDCVRTLAAGRSVKRRPAVPAAQSQRRDSRSLSVLTRRERQIAQSVVSGKRNREIAEAFGISTATVKLHLHRIYVKLGVNGRLALFRTLVEPPALV
jgi:DNA-binding NarL/FixJ family response regulator